MQAGDVALDGFGAGWHGAVDPHADLWAGAALEVAAEVRRNLHGQADVAIAQAPLQLGVGNVQVDTPRRHVEFDHVAILDEGDTAYRASRGNFALVWVQSKGMGMAAYGRWTLESARLWPGFADQLREDTGIDVGLEQKGGLYVLFGDKETEARVAYMTRMHEVAEKKGFIVVYPEGVWYTYVDQHDIDEIIDSHLVKGEVVERLRI